MADDCTLRRIAATCYCMHSRTVARLVTQVFDASLAPVGVRSTQFSTLVALERLGPQPLTYLAGELGLDRTTLTRNLQHMADHGWIVLRPGDDRRVHLATLTDSGRAVMRAGVPRWTEAQAKVTEMLGEPDGRAMITQFKSIIKRLREHVPPD